METSESIHGVEPVKDVSECRPEVKAFACLMEQKLRMNDHRPGWKDTAVCWLWDRLNGEADELLDVVSGGGNVGSEAADVANFAMMIADVCGALAPKDDLAPR